MIPLSRIRPNPFQPVSRLTPDPVYIEELAADIKQHGLLQSPAGRLVLDGEIQSISEPVVLNNWLSDHPAARIELVHGHHRVAAHRWLTEQGHPGYDLIACTVAPYTDEEMATLSYAENTKRRDLNPMEDALSIQAMKTRFGWTQEKIAVSLSLARSTIANRLRLLDLVGTPAGDALLTGAISERQAVAILPLYQLPEPAAGKIHVTIDSWRTQTRAATVLELAAHGESSDSIRRSVSFWLDDITRPLDRASWSLDTPFPQAEAPIRPNTCRDCSARQKHANLCCDPDCYLAREQQLKAERQRRDLALAAELTGYPVVEDDAPIHVLYGERGQATLKNGCPHGRLALGLAYGGYHVPGLPDDSRVRIVCAGHRGCKCMEAPAADQLAAETRPSPYVMLSEIDATVMEAPALAWWRNFDPSERGVHLQTLWECETNARSS